MAAQGDIQRPDPSARPPGESLPPPARLWWTRRLAIPYLLLVAALVISHFSWQRTADRRLAEALAMYKAAGISLIVKDYESPPVADEDNAAVLYIAALGEKDRSAIVARTLLNTRASWFDLVRQARGRTKLDWRQPPRGSYSFPFQSFMDLFTLILRRAESQKDQGQYAQAVQTLLDAEALSRAFGQAPSRAFGQAPAIMLRQFSLEFLAHMVERIVPDLQIVQGGEGTDPNEARADARSVRELANLLATEDIGLAEHHAWVVQVAHDYATARFSQERPQLLPPGLCRLPYVARPMLIADQAFMLRRHWWDIECCRQPLLRQARRCQDRIPKLGYGMGAMAHPFSFVFRGLNSPNSERQYGVIAESRLAAIRLALRLFELERGRLARSLEELVPDYLPAVPQDPMDPNGGPIRAVLEGPQPRVYSLGENMVDDGGRRDNNWPQPRGDVVYFLSPAAEGAGRN